MDQKESLVSRVLLVVARDGSLLNADPAALTGSPFADYRWPGILLAPLICGGYVLAGLWQVRSGFGARALSVFADFGLIDFETS